MTCRPRDASTSLHQRPQSSEQRLEMPESWTLVGPGVPGAQGRGGLVVAGVVSTWRVPPHCLPLRSGSARCPQVRRWDSCLGAHTCLRICNCVRMETWSKRSQRGRSCPPFPRSQEPAQLPRVRGRGSSVTPIPPGLRPGARLGHLRAGGRNCKGRTPPLDPSRLLHPQPAGHVHGLPWCCNSPPIPAGSRWVQGGPCSARPVPGPPQTGTRNPEGAARAHVHSQAGSPGRPSTQG